MTYEEWEREVPEVIKADRVWQFYAYRKALFLYDLAWEDCGKLMRDLRGQAVARQLIRSAGSISANVEEGYGRGFGKDRNYFLRISTGSARETRGWYYRSRHLLSTAVLETSPKLTQRNHCPSRHRAQTTTPTSLTCDLLICDLLIRDLLVCLHYTIREG